MSPDDLNTAALIREILEEARRVVGSGSLFAERLHELGVGPENGRYSQSAVSNWIKGRTMPPADVVLAAARLAGISLDRHILLRENSSPEEPEWRATADNLQRQIDSLQAQIIEICGRLGVPVPSNTATQAADETHHTGSK